MQSRTWSPFWSTCTMKMYCPVFLEASHPVQSKMLANLTPSGDIGQMYSIALLTSASWLASVLLGSYSRVTTLKIAPLPPLWSFLHPTCDAHLSSLDSERRQCCVAAKLLLSHKGPWLGGAHSLDCVIWWYAFSILCIFMASWIIYFQYWIAFQYLYLHFLT